MLNEILLYAGAGIIILWGIAHIIPTKMIVGGFGDISEDNRKILTMEVLAEGITLCFLGILVVLVTTLSDSTSTAALVTYRSAGGVLVLMALLTTFTGARTPTIWYKICPLVKLTVSALYILGSVL